MAHRARYPVKPHTAMRDLLVILLWVHPGITHHCNAGAYVCASCGRYIEGTVYTIWDRVENVKKGFCESCAFLGRNCSLCRLPAKENYMTLSDGRFLCSRDASRVVMDAEEAKRI